MGAKIIVRVASDNPGVNNNPTLQAAVQGSIEGWFDGGGHTLERKISRLTEKLKDAMEAGSFGDLFEPDGTTRTLVGVVFEAFQDVYNTDFLALFDEEGELLP